MLTTEEKARLFRSLHQREGAFIIPNPWDVGTARLLAQLGFQALATTGAGYAFSTGRSDHMVGREEMLRHASAIAEATELPVSADLGNGFGDSPETVAETIRLAASAGLAGCSIEDAAITGSIYDQALAVERIVAAAQVGRSLRFPFTLTARCENYLCGRPNLENTIQRLQAYQQAGADVLYAPGLTTIHEIGAVVRAVDGPVNALMGLHGSRLSLKELAELGVKRVSVGSALYRAAIGAFLRAAREMSERGTFTFGEQAVSYRELNAMFGPRS